MKKGPIISSLQHISKPNNQPDIFTLEHGSAPAHYTLAAYNVLLEWKD